MNLNPTCSFIKTIPAGTEALKGETILQMPESSNVKEKQQLMKTKNKNEKLLGKRRLVILQALIH